MRIPYSTIVELFVLDSSSPTGLSWRIDNPRKGQNNKSGDHVRSGHRWARGLIPIVNTRKRLAGEIDESGREVRPKKGSRKLKVSDYSQDVVNKIFERYNLIDGELIWRRSFKKAASGDVVKGESQTILGHELSQDEIRFIIDQCEPEKVEQKEKRDLYQVMRMQLDSLVSLANDRELADKILFEIYSYHPWIAAHGETELFRAEFKKRGIKHK